MAAASIAFSWIAITTLSVFALSALGRATMVSDADSEVLSASLAFEGERARARAYSPDKRAAAGR